MKRTRKAISVLLALLMILCLLPTTFASAEDQDTETDPDLTIETEPEETEPEEVAEPEETESEGDPEQEESVDPIRMDPEQIGTNSGEEPEQVHGAEPLTAGSGTEADPYIVTADTTEFVDGGYYLVDSDVVNGNRIEVKGTAVLILGSGKTLTAQAGIQVGGNRALTIRGTGALIATASNNNAGIGGKGDSSGNIVIEGGTVTATGGQYGAGIGGGNHGRCETVTITGGTVTATGGQNAAGIGGGANNYWVGRYGNVGTITITGGTVTATGNGPGAGIGGGGTTDDTSSVEAGQVDSIAVTGGNVTATSDNGYGIGPGRNSAISENDGTLAALLLGYSSATDSITASSIHAAAATVVDGQVLSDGENEYSGTLTDEQLSAAAGKTLVPGILPDGFYLIGPDWTIGAIRETNQFSPNPANASEYMLETTLSAGDQIKVVKIASGAIAAWYPDGLGNQYTVDAAHAGNKTVYFKETYQNGWSAFGGYFWIDASQSHSVTVANGIENGTVVSDKATATADETVTLTVTPKSGYMLQTLTVTCGNDTVETMPGENHTYTFIMPDGDVSISAVFVWSTASSDHTIFTEYVFESGSAGYNNEGPENLIDGKTSTKWCTTIGTGITITFHVNIPILPVGYILTTANDTAGNSGRNPSAWTIEGKMNESDEWTTLAAVTGNSTLPAANFKDTEFVLDTMKTCRYFRVTFSALREGTTFQLSEFRFFGELDAVVRIMQCAPTCVSMGYAQDCWYNYEDDTYYADKECTQPLNREDVEIPATGIHTLEEHPEVEPVGNTPGNIHYWQCIVCHKYFSDDEAANEITENDTIVYGPIAYLDENGTLQQTTGAYNVVSSDVLEWTAGWWIVLQNVTIEGRPIVNGDVHLILCDGATLTATNGVGVSTSANSLTVYSQSLGENMGALIAGPAQNYYAGIGGTRTGSDTHSGANGPITINGGRITAKGGQRGAGIGGGNNGAGFSLITINNGDIDAWGGDIAAGIGTGYGPSGNMERAKVVINGGNVVAHAGSKGAGIGGGEDANAEYITINGGNITAYGGESAAAIGGGYVLNSGSGHGGNITINGGNVTAIAGANGNGIGDAPNLKNDAMTTNIVLSWTDETDSITSSSYVCNSLTLEKDFMIQGTDPAEYATVSNIAGKTIVPFIGQRLTVTFVYERGGSDIFAEAYVASGGTPEDPGTPMKLDSLFDGWYYLNGENVVPFVCGTTAVNADTTVFAQWTSTVGQTVTYLDAEGNPCSKDRGYTVLRISRAPLILKTGWYVVKQDFTLDERVTVSGNVHLILSNGVTLNAQKGIQVGVDNSLTIYQNAEQAEGETVGVLICNAIGNAAGIGGSGEGSSNPGHAGAITINGSSITAKGGQYGAGIGGGNYGNGTVVINGGIVNATGDLYAAGIGGGNRGSGTVTINGGNVTAKGASNGAGIGGGNYGSGTVTISGGTVNATGNSYSAGIGGGNYGSATVTINGGSVTATGGQEGAGIGSGYSISSWNPVSVDITINGGSVNATGGLLAAGIGGGVACSVNKIMITGGVVVANGSTYAAAIGGGSASWEATATSKGNCGTLVISGGQVTANAGTGGVGIGNSTYCTTSGTIELGWTNETDSITATSYKGPVTVTPSSPLTDGENKYYGALTDEQISAAAGKTLTPTTSTLRSVTVETEIENGTVTADKVTAYAGDIVTLTVTPAQSYVLVLLSVSDGQNAIETTAGENNTYTFRMPDADVTVDAAFEIEDGFYLIGPDWTLGAIDLANKFVPNPANDGEYILETKLAYGDEVKVVKLVSGAIAAWYPDGMDNQYKVDRAHAGDRTICFSETYNSDWSAFGGYFWIDAAIYSITVADGIENGTVTADSETAQPDATVTLTVAPADGYLLETLTVTGGGNTIATEAGDNGTYTFVMPECDVTVTATFGIDWSIIPDAGIDLLPTEVEFGIISANGYLDISVTADTLTLGKFSCDDRYCQADFCKVMYYAGTLKNGDNEIPFAVYSADHEGEGDCWGLDYEVEGQSDVVSIYIEPDAYDAAEPGDYTGMLDYTPVWADSFGNAAEGSSGSIALKLTVVKRYSINIDENIENGTVTADKTKAGPGETVTLFWRAESPYKLETVTVMAGTTSVEVTEDESGITFVMPESDVTVSATFEKYYPVYVGGTQISGKNYTDVLGDGTISYDPEESVLTVLSTEGIEIEQYGTLINTFTDLTIVPADGTLEVVTSVGSYGVTAYGANLTINGNVVLDVPNGTGIFCTSTLTINGTLTGSTGNMGVCGINGLNVKSVSLTKSGNNSYALCSYSGIISVDGDMTFNGLAEYAVYAIMGFSCTGDVSIVNTYGSGIFCPSGDITIGGAVTIDANDKGINYGTSQTGNPYKITIGGDTLIKTKNNEGVSAKLASMKVTGDLTVQTGSNGVETGGALEVTGDVNVTAASGNGVTCYYSGGLSVGGDITVKSAGTGLTAYGGEMLIEGAVSVDAGSSGIFCTSGPVTVSGDVLIASSSTAITVHGGKLMIDGNVNVTTTGGSGIFCTSGPVTVGGDVLIASWDNAITAYGGELTIGGNADFTVSNGSGIYCTSGFTEIGGNVKVKSSSAGITVYGGRLTIGGTATVESTYSNGIYTTAGAIQIGGAADIMAYGYGIGSMCGSVIIDGDLTLTSGDTCIEVHGSGSMLSVNGDAEITRDTTSSLKNAVYCTETGGIEIKGNLDVRNGTIQTSYGMHVTGDTKIENPYGNGINASSGQILLDGDVSILANNCAITQIDTVIGGDARIYSFSDCAINLTTSNDKEQSLTVKGRLYVIALNEECAVNVKGDVNVSGDLNIITVGCGVCAGGTVKVGNNASVAFLSPEEESGTGAATFPIGIEAKGAVIVSGDLTIPAAPDNLVQPGSFAELQKKMKSTFGADMKGETDAVAFCGVKAGANSSVDGDVSMALEEGDGLYAFRIKGSLQLRKSVHISVDGDFGSGIVTTGSVTINGVTEIETEGEGSIGITSEGNVTIRNDVTITAAGDNSCGIRANGRIVVARGDWDVKAVWPMQGYGGIVIRDSHVITVPEAGYVDLVTIDENECYIVLDPADPSVYPQEVVIVQTGVDLEGKIEWNTEDVQFKGTTAYVIANGEAHTPRFIVKNSADGSVIDPANYDFEYRENTNAGTGYVFVYFKNGYCGEVRASFKIYLPATTETAVENINEGIKVTWAPVEGADGYVIYRRAWSSTTDGWTDFVRWNNTTALEWVDTTVYAGTRYQYGIKAYFAKRLDPIAETEIGGNVGDNFNLGMVGPLKTTVRITTRKLKSVTGGDKQITVEWEGSKNFTGYQIKYATDENFTKNVKAIKITNASTYSKVITGLNAGTTYYVTVRSYHEFNGMTYYGGWSNVLSAKAGAKPMITTQPTNKTVAVGKSVTFKVVASGSGLSYQWYYRKSSTGTWAAISAASGKTASYTLTAEARHNGYQYRCKVSNELGTVYTNIVTLKTGTAPTITTQPTNKTVAAGKTVTFKVTASGSDLSYQWYYRKSSTGTWTAISAASGKTASYTLTAAARHNGYQYRCKVSNEYGYVYTNTVKLTVTGN